MIKITPEKVEAEICAEQYEFPVGTTLTICVLTLQNGYTVTGEAACVDPLMFDEEIGKKVARAKAVEKIWSLLAFSLRDHIVKRSWGHNGTRYNGKPNTKPNTQEG